MPRLPRKTKVDVTKCHACHVKRRWMSPNATPATQSAAPSPATKRAQARHQVQQAPHLPRETKVDVAKRHACHAKRRWMSPSATPACHVKRRWMSPGATPAPQSTAASPAIKRAQAHPSAPPEPAQCHKCHACHANEVDVTKCHACHTKRRWMSPSATPATQSTAASPAPKHAQARHQATSATPATRNEGACRQVPRLPRETKVDVTKCHACHAKYRGVTGDQACPSAPKRAQARNQSQPSAVSATPTTTTQNEGGCHQVPRLPRETRADVTKLGGVTGAQARPSAPKRAQVRLVDVIKRHACHAKCRG